MGWIANRSMRSGGSLYEGGPQRKGPLVKIKQFLVYDKGVFAQHTALLECGHIIQCYGEKRAVCHKCRVKAPKDTADLKVWRKLGRDV